MLVSGSGYSRRRGTVPRSSCGELALEVLGGDLRPALLQHGSHDVEQDLAAVRQVGVTDAAVVGVAGGGAAHRDEQVLGFLERQFGEGHRVRRGVHVEVAGEVQVFEVALTHASPPCD
jgi:hypothetical protein